ARGGTMSSAAYTMPAHNWLTESELLFHPEQPDQCNVHPLAGLIKYGPYSQTAISQVLDPLRVGFIVANGQTDLANQLLAELQQLAPPKERLSYLIEYPGFSQVFRIRTTGAPKGCHIELDQLLDEKINTSPDPHLVLAEGLTKALSSLDSYRNEFDV